MPAQQAGPCFPLSEKRGRKEKGLQKRIMRERIS